MKPDPVRRTSVALRESEWRLLDKLAKKDAEKFGRRQPNRSGVLRRFLRFAPQVEAEIKEGRL